MENNSFLNEKTENSSEVKVDGTTTRIFTKEQIQVEQANFISKVFAWMSLALLITGLTSYFVASTPEIVMPIVSNRLLYFGLLIGEVILVGYISSAISRLSVTTTVALYIFYSILNGLTLSIIFLVYTTSSIASTFFITAGTFSVMAAYGYYTKTDLTSMGKILFMGLIGLIIASIVNIFMNSSILYWVTTYVGIFIFTGLTAYDIQKIKEMNIIGNEGTDEDKKEAISGALTLYLDFINLFIYILRIFGDRK